MNANLVFNGESMDSLEEAKSQHIAPQELMREYNSGHLKAWLYDNAYDEELAKLNGVAQEKGDAISPEDIAEALGLTLKKSAESVVKQHEESGGEANSNLVFDGCEEAERKAREEAERKARVEGSFAGATREIEIAPGVKMAFVWVAPGSFRMGSDDSDACDNEKPVHQVTLTKGYWLGKYEVTQAEWRGVMGSNPSRFKGDRRPVEQVSWSDCQEYVKMVNEYLAERGEALRVRLPTEAEWEFAARGGTESKGYKYSGSDNLDAVAWHAGNSGGKMHGETYDVGTKEPNELGLHDMSGNVWEWCQDWYGDYSSDAVTDPRGPGSGDDRVLRGGGWLSTARYCRSATRNWGRPDNHSSDRLGVRLASGQ